LRILYIIFEGNKSDIIHFFVIKMSSGVGGGRIITAGIKKEKRLLPIDACSPLIQRLYQTLSGKKSINMYNRI